MSNKPFIHLLKSPYGYYFFDVNRNEIVSTTKELYEKLITIEEVAEEKVKYLMDDSSISSISKRGFLSNKRPTKIKHPLSDQLEWILDNSVEKITLQLTQNCNFRCKYCAYTNPSAHRQRTHSNVSMSIDTAKAAIDFYVSRSSQVENLAIGFYGGEPFLEFNLMKEIIEYVDSTYIAKPIRYHITTNGSILTEEIMEYCITHGIYLMISLDGSKEVNDRNRVFAHSGEGTFDFVMNNINALNEKYPQYFEKILFSTVIDPCEDFDCYNKLYMDYGNLKKEQTLANFVNTGLTTNESAFTDSFRKHHEYDRFLAFLHRFDRVDKDILSSIVRREYDYEMSEAGTLKPMTSLFDEMAPSGPCIPGALRLLVDVQGNLFPCERCSETSSFMRIGSIYDGFDIQRAQEILNIGMTSEERCKDCWVICNCSICATQIEDGNGISAEMKNARCKEVCATFEKRLLNKIALHELQELFYK